MKGPDEQELLGVEKRFWEAIQAKDSRGTAQLTDDRCIVVGAQGIASIDRPTMGKLTEEGSWEVERFTLDEQNAQVLFVGKDVALVAYTVQERVVVDGETLPIEANDSSVWVRRDGEWRCAMHTESLAGDPFGRDRRT